MRPSTVPGCAPADSKSRGCIPRRAHPCLKESQPSKAGAYAIASSRPLEYFCKHSDKGETALTASWPFSTESRICVL
eukprot:15821214-Heterocapsa_arctica.AAC.1